MEYNDQSSTSEALYTRGVAFLFGLLSGAAFSLIWSLASLAVGDYARIFVPLLSAGIAGGVAAYRRDASVERVLGTAVFMAFAAVFINLLLAKTIGTPSPGRRFYFGDFITDHNLLVSVVDISVAALIGAVFSKPEPRRLL